MVKVVVIGFNRIGENLTRDLANRGKNVLVVDRAEEKVAEARELVEAVQADAESLDKVKENLRNADIFVILISDFDAGLCAVDFIRQEWADKTIFIRCPNRQKAREAEERGADRALVLGDLLDSSVMELVQKLEQKHKLRSFSALIQGVDTNEKRHIGIFIHNTPDPDAIASAMAAGFICQNMDKAYRIYYGGRIDHQENRSLVNMLDVEMEAVEDGKMTKALEDSAMKMFLDMSLPGSNNNLPEDTVPDIIIDHHPSGEERPKARYIDIRKDTGATSTILSEYLEILGLELDTKLASALIYGIRTDTNRFLRNFNMPDVMAVTRLMEYADPELIQTFEYSPMTAATMEVLGKAIMNKEIRAPYLISCVDIIPERDSLPQAADYLLQLEGISTTLIYGIVGDTIHASARSKDSRVNIGQVMREAFGEGNAGGHSNAGAAQISLGIFGEVDDKNTLIKLAKNAITKNFFKAMGIDTEEEEEGEGKTEKEGEEEEHDEE